MIPRIALPELLDAELLAAHDPGAAIRQLQGETMGTSWQVHFAARARPTIAEVAAAIAECLATINAEMSHWQADSAISAFNRAPAGSWLQLPAQFAQVLARGLAIAAQTDGAFDPTLGRLAALAGYGPEGAAAVPAVGAQASAVAEALAQSGWRRLAFDPASGRLRQPGGLWLDLSGIAKGYAVDAVAACLAALGLRHFLVEIGGELVGQGLRPDGDPWWVDLEVPPGLPATPLRIALHGLAVATSGTYRRGLHCIDPVSGQPLRNGVVSVSVIAATALDADAWATALQVTGTDAGLRLAGRHVIAARWLLADGRELLSPALAAMLADSPATAPAAA